MLEAALFAVEASPLLYVSYRSIMALGGLLPPRAQMRGAGESSFLILIAARNEEKVIGASVSHLLALDYPAVRRQVVVLADDCSDGTAAAAQEAGAEVLVRFEAARGKGAALRWALAQPAIRLASWDALVILDADSRPE